MEFKLRSVLKILPSDYKEFGGDIERWADPNKDYPDCSYGCKHFIKLREVVGNDWGVCCSPNSDRKGLLTWEHMSGFHCFEKEKND